VLIQADRPGVAAHNALVENPAGKQAKPLLLQRNQVALADFGDCGYLFQRNAAGQPLHAQVFSKVSHRRKKDALNFSTLFHNNDRPGFRSSQKIFIEFFLYFHQPGNFDPAWYLLTI
jgi:hypothetical protein